MKVAPMLAMLGILGGAGYALASHKTQREEEREEEREQQNVKLALQGGSPEDWSPNRIEATRTCRILSQRLDSFPETEIVACSLEMMQQGSYVSPTTGVGKSAQRLLEPGNTYVSAHERLLKRQLAEMGNGGEAKRMKRCVRLADEGKIKYHAVASCRAQLAKKGWMRTTSADGKSFTLNSPSLIDPDRMEYSDRPRTRNEKRVYDHVEGRVPESERILAMNYILNTGRYISATTGKRIEWNAMRYKRNA